jgi:hypothetical protein
VRSGQVSRTVTEARIGATWRAALGIEKPSARLGDVIDALRRAVDTEVPGHDARTFDGVLAALRADRPAADELEALARRVLRSALEQRRTRQLKLGADTG